jgi:hypothetical protein
MKLSIDRLVLEVPGLTAADGERLASGIARALADVAGPGGGLRAIAGAKVVLDAAEVAGGQDGKPDLDRLALRVAGALQREWR